MRGRSHFYEDESKEKAGVSSAGCSRRKSHCISIC